MTRPTRRALLRRALAIPLLPALPAVRPAPRERPEPAWHDRLREQVAAARREFAGHACRRDAIPCRPGPVAVTPLGLRRWRRALGRTNADAICGVGAGRLRLVGLGLERAGRIGPTFLLHREGWELAWDPAWGQWRPARVPGRRRVYEEADYGDLP